MVSKKPLRVHTSQIEERRHARHACYSWSRRLWENLSIPVAGRKVTETFGKEEPWVPLSAKQDLPSLIFFDTDETLLYVIESDVSGSATSLALAKSLLLQLFQKNVGDKSFFFALVKAYEISISREAQRTDLEEALWGALDDGFDKFAGTGNDDLIIIVDGLDEMQDQQHLKTVMDRLGRFTSKHSRLQAITFSRNAVPKPSDGRMQPFEIKPDHTHEDLRHVAEHALRGCLPYDDRNKHAQEAIVESLIHGAKGNFLWLLLNIYSLKTENSSEGFEKAVKATKSNTPSLHATFDRLFANFNVSPDVGHIMSLMLCAERPLTIPEIKCFLEVDLEKNVCVQRKTDVDIRALLGPIVVVNHDLARFRHPAIRRYLLDLQSKGIKLQKPQDAQTDTLMRVLAYCKYSLTTQHEPSSEVIGWSHAKSLFADHALLEYAVRNWTAHFIRSGIHGKGSLQINGAFKDVFPPSTTMAMLEWACWFPQTLAVESYELALRVREAVFTQRHACVLQIMIACGTSFRKVSKQAEAGNFFYHASGIAQAILRKQHTVALTCANAFLALTEATKVTTRTELTTRKEETLKFVVDVYKHQQGHSHDLVIRYMKMLAHLYIEIHEGRKAEVIWREVREIVIQRFGKGSEVSHPSACPNSWCSGVLGKLRRL